MRGLTQHNCSPANPGRFKVPRWVEVGPVRRVMERIRPLHDDDPNIVELTMAVLWSASGDS